MDDPSAVVIEPAATVAQRPETVRQVLRGTRQALFGIELTLLAVLVAVMFGPGEFGGLVAFVMGFAGLVLVLEGTAP